MPQAVLASFLLVALSEFGDKTQLLAFSLAARFRAPWPVMAGILAATLLNHGLASTVGAWVASAAPPSTMACVLAAGFFAFGLWTLKPDTLDGDEGGARRGAFVTTLVLFFLAEMGDKTQLATVALAAQFRSATWVTLGTTLGMLVTDGLAVFLGHRLAGKAQHTAIRVAAAVTFFAFAGFAAWSAIHADAEPSTGFLVTDPWESDDPSTRAFG